MKVYISGDYENPEMKPFFKRREVQLTEMGYKVTNPFKEIERLRTLKHREPTRPEIYLNNLSKLLDCDFISMMDGWENSEFAKFEKDIAAKSGKSNIGVRTFR